MAKSKNHTAHNQTYKAHRNGIKKPKRFRKTSMRGVSLLHSLLPTSYFMISGRPQIFEELEVCSQGPAEGIELIFSHYTL